MAGARPSYWWKNNTLTPYRSHVTLSLRAYFMGRFCVPGSLLTIYRTIAPACWRRHTQGTLVASWYVAIQDLHRRHHFSSERATLAPFRTGYAISAR